MALHLLRDMRSEGIAPNLQTFSYLVEACEEGGRFDAALELMNQLDQRGERARTGTAAVQVMRPQ
eukprot:UN2905